MFVVVLLVLARARPGRLRSCGSARPTRARSRRSRPHGARTTCSPRASAPGFNGPIPIVVDVNGDEEAPQRVYDGVQGLEGVASVGEPQFNDAKTVAIVFVTPDSAPQDEETGALVDRLQR